MGNSNKLYGNNISIWTKWISTPTIYHNKNLFELDHKSKCKKEKTSIREQLFSYPGLSNSFLYKTQKNTTGKKIEKF